MEKQLSIIDKTINYCFRGVIIILPLFFLPFNLFSAGMDSFGKSFFLYASSILLLALLIYKKRKNKDNNYDFSYLGYLILFFVSVLFISGALGINFMNSFWGQGGMTLSILNYLSFFLLYFFIINYVKNTERLNIAIRSVVFSYLVSVWFVFLVFLVKWFSLIGPSSEIFSVINAQNGSFEDFSIFLTVMSVFILGFVVMKKSEIFSRLWIVKISWIVGIFLLVQINYIFAWVLLFLSLIIFSFNIFKFKLEGQTSVKQAKKIVALLFLLSSVMLLMNFSITGQSSALNSRLAKNFHLDFKNSRSVALKSLKERPVLGQGGENYKMVFSKNRDASMNDLAWWDKRFEKSFTYACDVLVASGIIGFLSFLAMLFAIVFFYIKIALTKIKDREEGGEAYTQSVFLLLLTVILSFFLYNTTLNLLFLFFLFLGLSNFIIQKHSFSYPEFTKKLPQKLVFKNEKTFLILVTVLFVSASLILSFKMKAVFAQISFEKYLKSTNEQEREVMLARANNINSKNLDYKMALSRFYKNKFDNQIKDNQSLDYSDFEEEMNLSITAGKSAIFLAPNSVAAYELLGSIYRDVSQFSNDSASLAITAFERASELEPTNPILSFELSKLYNQTEKNDEAKKLAEKALLLKGDLYEARLLLARIMIKRGELAQALKELESLEGVFDNVQVKYEIGRIYFNQKKYAQAQEQFREVVRLSPNYSNALYSLALCLEKLNKRDEALEYYKKVLNLNPDNTDIRKKIIEF